MTDIKPLSRGWKAIARDWCRQIARETPDGPVTGPDGQFLAALLTRHPDAIQKIGPGIAYISVAAVPGHPNTRGFTVHRTDGTSTDFSWVECITESSHRTRVLTAMREAVVPQILTFKQRQSDSGQLRCAVTGASLDWDDVHVDHLPPGFGALADDYATMHGGYAAIGLLPSRDKQIGRPLVTWHETAWQNYHQHHARLQILSVAAHLEITRERRQR